MKKWLALLLLQACFTDSFSQRLAKFPIGDSGCSAYFYCSPTFEVDYSADSSKVYSGVCEIAEIGYGLLCAKLSQPQSDLTVSEDLLIGYMDYLKKDFKIVSSAGYGKGHRLNNREDTRGVIDYWVSEDKDNWKVKGWTDGKFIVVMYVYSKKDLPEMKVNVFLESFRFPEGGK